MCLSERGCLSFVSDWFHDQFPCHFSVVEGKGNKVPPTACHSSVTIAVMQANKTPLYPFLYLFLLPLSLSPPHDAVTYEDCISIMIKNSDLSSFFFFFFARVTCLYSWQQNGTPNSVTQYYPDFLLYIQICLALVKHFLSPPPFLSAKGTDRKHLCSFLQLERQTSPVVNPSET